MPESDFEVRVAQAVEQLAGVPRPVDASAIHAHVKHEADRRYDHGWGGPVSLPAAAVVVLGLGLLALIATIVGLDFGQRTPSLAPAAPVAPSLEGYVTEEVEPGVRRVLDDGAGHQLSGLNLRAVAVGQDGDAWLLALGSTIALGREGLLPALPRRYDYGWPEAVTDGDGALWATWCGEAPFTLESGAWVAHPGIESSCASGGLDVSEDGVVWAATFVTDGVGPAIAREDGEAWTFIPPIDDPRQRGTYSNWFEAVSERDVWLANGVADAKGSAPSGLLHYDGSSWTTVSPIADEPGAAGPLAMGPGGTLWVFFRQPGPDAPGTVPESISGSRSEALGSRSLARLDEHGWTLFGAAEGVPNLSLSGSGRPVVDAEGRLWIGLAELGVASFDGESWQHYLDGSTVRDLAVATDGRVWVVADSGLFVIDPPPGADDTGPTGRLPTVDVST